MSAVPPARRIEDAEFRYLGFTESQIFLIRSESDEMREIVYTEGLRILMELGPGYGSGTPDGELNI